MKREEATAFHEAGHPVVGLRQGSPNRLLAVSIVPDLEDGSFGHVSRGKFPRVRDLTLGPDGPRHFYRDFNPEVDDRRVVEQRLKPGIVSGFAGVIAETRFTGRRHDWAGAAYDLHQAADAIDFIVGSARQAQKYHAYLWVVAEDAVTNNWQAIEALALELLARKRMSGLETRSFLATVDAAPRRPPAKAKEISSNAGPRS
jgi:hypothetical protein